MLCPSAMPSRDNSSIVASFLLFSVRSRAACAAPLQLNRVKESDAKLLQKSEMRKDIVIELSYKGFG